MTTYRIQNLRELRDEMKAVARGQKPAPADAARPSFNSVEALVRLLTPENRRLLSLIRDRKPRVHDRTEGMDRTALSPISAGP